MSQRGAHYAHLSARYCARSLPQLARRVSRTLLSDRADAAALQRAMLERRFLPAGNTLLAGVEPVRPNCVVLPAVGEHNVDAIAARARNLWRYRVGVGVDLTPARDPLAILERLHRENDAIHLGHRPKRGNMATLAADHPCAAEFCAAKRRGARGHAWYNFNLSLTLATRAQYEHFERELLDAVFARSVHACGDPGVVLLDRVRERLPYDHNAACALGLLSPIDTLVPCGEQALHADESCTLGSLNLAAPAFGGSAAQFDDAHFAATVRLAVRALDAAHGRCDYAGDAHVAQASCLTRRIGLGVMGLGALFPGRAFGNAECLAFVHRVGALLHKHAHAESRALAKRDGAFCSVPGATARKHVSITCVAPTGGISLIADTSPALEPEFASAHAVSLDARLAVLAAAQAYVDNAISTTLNVPASTSVAAIAQCTRRVLRAPEYASLKALTFYRDGSRDAQPMDCRSGTCGV